MVNYPRHLSTFSYVGVHRYFLTFCTYERRSLFQCGATVSLAWEQILRAASVQSMEVTAYCFMPDHVHLVVQGTQASSDLRRFVAAAKQHSGYEYARRNQGQKLWQRYSYERVLRDSESTQTVVRYVLENPVRKGMVMHPREYEFLGSSVYSLEALVEFAFATSADGAQAGSTGAE